jgi:hypothetical protein
VNDKTRKRMPARERGLRYPLEFVAAELGVDVVTLRRRCEDAGFGLNGSGLKFSEAHDAWSLKSLSEAARRRKNMAEAEASEIDTINKKRQFVFKVDHENVVKDLAVKTRTDIERMSFLTKEQRHRVIKALAEIKPSAAESSHK